MSKPKVRRAGNQGDDLTGFIHKGCGGRIVYNGNYFCEHWRECGGVSTCVEYNERTGKWGPPALLRQEEEFAAALKDNREGRYADRGEVEIL